MPSESDALTTPEAARLLGMKPRTLEKWRRQSFGPAFFYSGARVRYERATVEAWKRERITSGTRG